MAEFVCAALFPVQLEATLARAAAGAGGIGLLDCEFCRTEDLPSAVEHVQRLVKEISAEASIGLRIRASQLASYSALLKALAGRTHHIILCGWSARGLTKLMPALQSDGRNIWLEIRSGDEIALIDPALPIAGLVGRGAECGGRSGRESAFILCQHLARQDRPFWIQGGIGPHNATACRLAGAAGVILDDALLLLRESPLPPPWRAAIERLRVEDTIGLGVRWDDPCRVVDRADFPAAQLLKRRADEIADAPSWQKAIADIVGWGDPATFAWPLGQLAGQAASLARRYGTVRKLIRAVLEASAQQIRMAARQNALAPDGPLARAHGTRFPIVQGPMTRVSDCVPFADAVAVSGALPLFALALMHAPQLETLLTDAQRALEGRPWGVGILGFVPAELRQEQLAVVEKIKPPFALIAGGRPDQALELESRGIATYIHAPTPALLRLFLEQGARRFVFEGGECGGHTGPLNSFALWESMIDVLLELPADAAAGLHLLFAGGVHDARSSAMVAAMASPLVERGARIGVLMGTAYLFTPEAVKSGAIVEPFQRNALDCARTTIIETGPGHRIRCAPTPFIDSFETQRRKLRSAGVPPAQAGATLEDLVAGRLRIASKAMVRSGDVLQPANLALQRSRGLYMMGELAALRTKRVSCADLHEDVSAGATRLLGAAAAQLRTASRKVAPASEIAIVGMGCLLPRAHDPEQAWRNLLDQVDTIGEIPRERWDWQLYYDPDPAARDRINAKWGGFIDPLPFDALHFGIPPNSLPSISIPQLLALEVTRRALSDAGFGDSIADETLRERTAVFFGAANTADLEQLYKARSAMLLHDHAPAEDALGRLPEWTEESYPGILVNVIAGRVANRFDLGGPNFTIDAACASSLAALDMAVRELQSERSDLVLAGGVEFEQSPQAYMAFSKTRALSPRGRARVFDEQADGIVLSEGAVVLVLKRLADAERDGDRIYALVRGVAGSSDGRGMGLTAPKPAGQLRALRRAHDQAGTDLADLRLYEAHATGTAVGDRSELQAFTDAMREAGADARVCAIGSSKNVLGHTRAAAGMVGVLKSAMALYHRALPPHAGIEQPLELLRDATCPAYLLDKPLPWLAAGSAPRLAGVSAFGFGGTNFHAVLRDHQREPGASGAAIWPCELFVFGADDADALDAQIDRVIARLDDTLSLHDLAFSCARAAPAQSKLRLAIVAADAGELRRALASARESRNAGSLPPGVFYSSEEIPAKLAFLFPGQGSQHTGMGGELAVYAPEMRASFEQSDAIMADALGAPLSRLIWPPAAHDDAERSAQDKRLADTRVAQPAIAAMSCGMLDLVRQLGIEASCVAGHSFGEFVALHAGGVITREDLLRLAQARGQILGDLADDGAMAMAAMARAELEPYLAGIPDVEIANNNAPRQIVLSGRAQALDALLARLTAAGHTAKRLNVSAAFHSALMRPAREPFAAFLAKGIEIGAPRIPVHANLDGKPYPRDAKAIRRRLADHIETPVDFCAQIERMYASGVRDFLELGPGRVLTGLVAQILGERPHRAIALDGGMRNCLAAIGQLYAAGHRPRIEALFDGRPVSLVDLDRLADQRRAEPGWIIDGGRVRRTGEIAHIGQLPFLDRDTRDPHRAARLPAVTAGSDAQSLAGVYREYQETMRRFLEQQERILTQFVSPGAPIGMPALELADDPVPLSSAPALPQLIEPSLDRAQVLRQLIAMVSERTGYHSDMLRPEQDLEADLGIDSIKRVEILGKLLKTFPPGIAERAQKQFDRLTRAKSLHTMAELLMREIAMPGVGAHTTSIEIKATLSSTSGAARTVADDCPRFLMRGTENPLMGVAEKRLHGLYLVTEDSLGVAEWVIARLRKHGAEPGLIAQAALASQDAGGERVMVLREVHGPVSGVLHLGSLGLAPRPGDLDAWRAATATASKDFFHLMQHCMEEIQEARYPLPILAASQMSGDWGRGGAFPGSPAAGGVHGILRCLEREYPQVIGKVVDFNPAMRPEEIADRIVDEMLTPGGGSEVGYVGGHRMVFTAEHEALAASAAPAEWRPRAGWVVLVTGGARGITAEICRELAQPGVTLIVVGRSPEALRGKADDAAQERARNLESFRKAGASVEYHAVDVTSEDAFGGLIADIYRRFDRLDAVLHGAGIIEDQRFEAKDRGSFDRVFDTKADSTFILRRALRPEGLKWVVMFGSVSGRFGNRGQADYAAANETVNRLALEMDASWPATRVAAINWGPWRDIGMANAGVQIMLENEGIVPITAEAGRRFFVDEMSHGRKGEVEIIAGRGPWEAPSDQLLGSVLEASVLFLQVRELMEPAGEIG